MSNTRYIALDAFRGLTIALMILVNTPGSWSHVYAPFLHADWHGATPTDLIFPFFLFIIGSALYFAFSKTNFTYSQDAAKKILKRTAIIFGLGLALNAYGHTGPITELRLMGVLQRLGIAYGIAALMVLTLNSRQLIIASVSILLGYWGILHLPSASDVYSLEGNLIRQFDIAVMGANHLWQGKGLPFDPEGLLSTIPAIVNVLIGFEATRVLSNTPNKMSSINKLVLGAVGLILISLAWHQVMPINKSLWTSSYVLFSSGCALIVLAFFIWLVDIKQQLRLVDPLLVYGTNPMFIYVLSWLWATTYFLIFINPELTLYTYMFDCIALVMPEKLASFTFAFAHVVLFWLISNILYKRNIIIKV
ncbi:acyltransferase family protein [Psychrobium sp. 1_MG-2023]|uniref:acyltransferase family protein n=1 Tax=Psychrobium sp. 1_MG-2023 TaxID=3062624 RepID=UPI000C31C2E3|nr:heparan-alpha-glucosaminide N-acetyltransferase domain-containing protein [Psychrobium sp. 1_MG-2023]MDP2559529.1 DUF5009 domain-containing protein [Psychrobium sp. 1_MG-2023]PKF59369.1 hypothetical protein CW748_00925 [Alteromonadales bacterium alter-6D02]